MVWIVWTSFKNESSACVQKPKMRYVYTNNYKLSVKFIFNSTIIYTSAVSEIARNIKFNKYSYCNKHMLPRLPEWVPLITGQLPKNVG